MKQGQRLALLWTAALLPVIAGILIGIFCWTPQSDGTGGPPAFPEPDDTTIWFTVIYPALTALQAQ